MKATSKKDPLDTSCRFQADAYYNAAHIIGENDISISKKVSLGDTSSIRQTVGVSITLLAFAVELYTKDLHFAIYGEAPQEHNILTLFEKLPEDIQKIILSDFSINTYRGGINLISSRAKTPMDCLKDISRSFEEWRYAYEKTTLRYEIGFALILIEVIKKIADSTRQSKLLSKLNIKH